MSECAICGPYFIGMCPHKMQSLKTRTGMCLDWRSDDFGHDCQALLEAESRALQDLGEKWILEISKLEAKLAIAVEAIEKIEGRVYYEKQNDHFVCKAILKDIEATLSRIKGGEG